ncbi:MAG: hypothetical protein AAGE52_08260 [Myxococcota bacterium]
MSDWNLHVGPSLALGGPDDWVIDVRFRETPTEAQRGEIARALADYHRESRLDVQLLRDVIYAAAQFMTFALAETGRYGQKASEQHALAFLRALHAAAPMTHATIWRHSVSSELGPLPGYPRVDLLEARLRPVDPSLPTLSGDRSLLQARRAIFETLEENESQGMRPALVAAFEKADEKKKPALFPLSLAERPPRPTWAPDADAARVLGSRGGFPAGPRVFCREWPNRLWFVDGDALREVKGGGRITGPIGEPTGTIAVGKESNKLCVIDFASAALEVRWKSPERIVDLAAGPGGIAHQVWVGTPSATHLVDVAKGESLGAIARGNGNLFSAREGRLCFVEDEKGKKTWCLGADGAPFEVGRLDIGLKTMFCFEQNDDIIGVVWRHTPDRRDRLGGIAKAFGVVKNLDNLEERIANARKKAERAAKRNAKG